MFRWTRISQVFPCERSDGGSRYSLHQNEKLGNRSQISSNTLRGLRLQTGNQTAYHQREILQLTQRFSLLKPATSLCSPSHTFLSLAGSRLGREGALSWDIWFEFYRSVKKIMFKCDSNTENSLSRLDMVETFVCPWTTYGMMKTNVRQTDVPYQFKHFVLPVIKYTWVNKLPSDFSMLFVQIIEIYTICKSAFHTESFST